jgi:hypothetical protein
MPNSWTTVLFCNETLTDGPTRLSYDSAMTDPRKPVFEFRAAPPAKQNRWGVLLRVFLVIPQLLFAGLLLYAAVALTFFAWFYAVFTGRNPYHEFNSKALRTYQRFTGYFYFLTSEYPPFSLDEDPDYAMASQLEQGELGRGKGAISNNSDDSRADRYVVSFLWISNSWFHLLAHSLDTRNAAQAST